MSNKRTLMQLVRCFLESPDHRSMATTRKSHVVTATWALAVMSHLRCPLGMSPQSLTSLLSGPAHVSGGHGSGPGDSPALSSWGKPFPSLPGISCSWASGARSYAVCTLCFFSRAWRTWESHEYSSCGALVPFYTITPSNMEHRSNRNPSNFWSHALTELHCIPIDIWHSLCMVPCQ